MIIKGDCIEQMKKMEPNSVDTIITDPPAGIAFMGKEWDKDKGGRDKWIEWFGQVMSECYRVAKPGVTALVWALPRTSHWTALGIEAGGWVIKDCIYYMFGSGFPKATDISKQLDKGHKRKVIGRNPNFRNESGRKGYLGESNFRQTDGMEFKTEPATPEAKLWNGWKSHGLKPAVECWWVAMKPNDGTYANNALKWGVSGLNIDGGRIGTGDKETKRIRKNTKAIFNQAKGSNYGGSKGRFPANIILDEEAAKLLDQQSGVSKSGKNKLEKGTGGIWKKGTNLPIGQEYDDKGGASRFFYCAKASKTERNAGCEGLEIKQTTGGGGMNNTENDVCGKYGSIKSAGHNHHPTVKPLALMEYLCLLTKTPTGGTVLDPFMGSGTTGLACQNTGREFIGIEKEEEYIKIAEARLKHNIKQKRLL